MIIGLVYFLTQLNTFQKLKFNYTFLKKVTNYSNPIFSADEIDMEALLAQSQSILK